MQKPVDIWKPALIAGGVFGFVTGIPILGDLLTCLCCAPIVAAGVLSAYLMVKASLEPLTYGRAAIGGLLSGLIAAPASMLSTLLFLAVRGETMTDHVEESIEQMSQFSAEVQSVAEMVAGVATPILALAGVFILLIIFAPFGTVGGILGRAIFEKRSAQPPAMQPGPPPPGPPPADPGGATGMTGLS